jgi:hypothetical protein
MDRLFEEGLCIRSSRYNLSNSSSAVADGNNPVKDAGP